MTDTKPRPEHEGARTPLREALDELYKDNHRWSTRPCATCSAITKATGIPFGCDKKAGRLAEGPGEAERLRALLQQHEYQNGAFKRANPYADQVASAQVPPATVTGAHQSGIRQPNNEISAERMELPLERNCSAEGSDLSTLESGEKSWLGLRCPRCRGTFIDTIIEKEHLARCCRDCQHKWREVPPATPAPFDVGKLAARLAAYVWNLSPIGSIGRMELTRYVREEIDAALAGAQVPPANHSREQYFIDNNPAIAATIERWDAARAAALQPQECTCHGRAQTAVHEPCPIHNPQPQEGPPAALIEKARELAMQLRAETKNWTTPCPVEPLLGIVYPALGAVRKETWLDAAKVCDTIVHHDDTYCNTRCHSVDAYQLRALATAPHE